MDLDENDALANFFKIRTITAFISESINYTDPELLSLQVEPAAEFLQKLQSIYESKGYEVQTIRIATRALQQNITSRKQALDMAIALEQCCVAHGLSFLSLGSTSPANSRTFLSDKHFISELVASLKFTSLTVAWQPEWDFYEAKRLAEEIFRIAELTDGDANFRFAVSFNCKPGIPFFPAAEAPPPSSRIDKNEIPPISFAIGTENSGLLYEAFSKAAAAADMPRRDLADAHLFTKHVLNKALQPIENEAKKIASSSICSSEGRKVYYLGIDTSVAPCLEESTTITAAFEKLPLLEKFGDSGTLAITERVTQALQSVSVDRIGYCGLMLPVCEDRGLAKAAEEGRISIQSLLQYSAVCGVGLDTVPVPGPGPNATTKEREVLVTKAAAVLLDVAALSQRLGGKQLSVRLLPVLGAIPGEKTSYTSPYLVDSGVMSL